MTRKQKKRLIRIIISAVALLIIVLLPITAKIKAFIFLIPYLIIGYDILLGAFRNIANGRFFDEKFLMSVATIGAFALGEFTEAAAVMLFYQIGELFQSMAVGKSRKSIAALMDIRPDSATVIRNGEEIKLSPSEVLNGEAIIIRSGEKIPLDGIVLSGSTTVNTSALTGESLPADITVGDRVISGSVNGGGVITVKTESIYSDSTVAKILDLVENASSKKAKTENFITRFAKYYTPTVVFTALSLAIIPPVILGGGFSVFIKRALIFLVVSCPCALVISVPLSFFGGIGGASKCGILIKGANYLEILAKADTFVFDKTGTLTNGSFKVSEIYSESLSNEELLNFAAVAESHSNHPIAKAIIDAADTESSPAEINTTEHSGMGIETVIEGKKILAGNARLMKKFGIKYTEADKIGTIIHIAVNKKYLGYILIADEVKPTAKETLKALKSLKILKTVMLTGDKHEIGNAVGKEIGIDEILTELLPDGKVNAIEDLINRNSTVAFVGDGINDAPVLARADIGIAMGALGSDAAIEAADIVLTDDKIEKLPEAVKIARKTMRIVKENIIFSLAVKGAVLLLSTLGIANMWLAVFADVGVTVIAILNAIRAMK